MTEAQIQEPNLPNDRVQLKRVIIVSRHPAAIEYLWECLDLSTAVHRNIRQVEHLDDAQIADITYGDRVMGTIPMSVAARLCAKGVECWHLELDITPHMRGRELTRADMEAMGARLVRYHVEDVSEGV